MDNADVLLISMGYIVAEMGKSLEQENRFSEEDQIKIVNLLYRAFVTGAVASADNISTLGPDEKATLAASQLRIFAECAKSAIPTPAPG